MTLSLENVSISYETARGPVAAVKNVSLSVEPGQTLGVVGESGSGKSTVGLAVMRLLPSSARVTGAIRLNGHDVLTMSEVELRALRGSRLGMVFQDSLASMNPVFSVYSQLADTLRAHGDKSKRKQLKARVAEMLAEVGLPGDRMRSFPHQFSGGMRQRVMIAAALACKPEYLIADEATSDLDTVSQRQILDLLRRIQADRKLGLIVVSHDLGVINHLCDKVAVMYRGDLVEEGVTAEVLANPQHWYTRGLVTVSAKELDEVGRLKTLRSRAQDAKSATPSNPEMSNSHA